MEDTQIIDLYWNRSETAISETAVKYGSYCYHIAYNILTNNEDAEESVSDTYMAAWNRLPPHRPAVLSSFLGKITRYIAISRFRSRSACKRGGGEMVLALEELLDCADTAQDVEKACEYRDVVKSFNRFLDTLPKTERDIFLRRYFFLDPIADIAESFGFSGSKVTSMLYRTRQKLKKQLDQEGLL